MVSFAPFGTDRLTRVGMSAEGVVGTISSNAFLQGSDVFADFTAARFDDRFTLARSTTGTYFDTLGNLLVAPANTARFGADPSEVVVRSNQLLYSDQFDNAAWDKIDSTLLVNNVTPPLSTGSSNAERLCETLTLGYHRAAQTVTLVTGATYTFSIYIRPQGRNFAYLEVRTKDGAYPGCYFNVSTGVVGSASGGAIGTIEGPFFASFFRCSITVNAAAGALPTYVAVMPALGDNQRNYTGTNTASGLAIWGAQMELGSRATEHIPTTTSAITVTTPAPLKGLLLERGATNAIRNSSAAGYTVGVIGSGGAMPTNWAAFSNPGWTYEVMGGGSQYGVPYVDVRISGASTTATNCQIGFDGTTAIIAAVGNTFTASAFLAIVGGSLAGTQIQLYQRHATSAAALTGYDLGPMIDLAAAAPARLPRYSTTATISAAGTERTASGVRVNIAANSTVDITLRLGLPQVEGTHHVTSPILTTGAAAPRTADIMTMTGGSGLQTGAGTLVSEYVPTGYTPTTSVFVAAIDDGTTTNRAIQFLNNGVPFYAVQLNSVNQAANLTAGTDPVVYGQLYSQGATYGKNYFAATVNGRWGLTDLLGDPPTNFTTISLGSELGANQTSLFFRRFSFVAETVTQETLAARSIPTDGGLIFLAYPTSVAIPAPVTGTSALTQNYTLAASPVAVPAPAAGITAMQQQLGFLPVSLTGSAPVAAAASLSQGHVLAAAAVATPVPAAGTAGLIQNHGLATGALATPAPVAGTAGLGQAVSLSAAALTLSAPIVAPAALSQQHVLAATGLATPAPAVPAAGLVQNHALTGTAVAAGSPVVDTTALDQRADLLAAAITIPAPLVGQAPLYYSSELAGIPVEPQPPEVVPAVLVQSHLLGTGNIVAGTPAVGVPTATVLDLRTAVGVTVPAPIVGGSALTQIHRIGAQPYPVVFPSVGMPSAYTDGVAYVFATPSLWSPRPQAGTAAMVQHQFLQAAPVAGAIAVPDPAAVHQEQAFQAAPVAGSAPVLGTSTAREVIPFAAVPVSTAAPVVSRPAAWWQEHNLGQGTTQAPRPVAGKPSVIQLQVLSAASLIASQPQVQAAVSGEGHLLTPLASVTGIPTVGEPALQPTQTLLTSSILVGRPVVGRTGLSSTHYIYVSSLTAPAPVAGSPVLNGRPGVAVPRHRPGTAAPRGLTTPRVA